MYHGLRNCTYIRLAQDTIPERSIFFYKYFSDDLLGLTREDLPIALTKKILKDTLRGLAELHDQKKKHCPFWQTRPPSVYGALSGG